LAYALPACFCVAAQRAADLGDKDHGVAARVLLGRILVTENKMSEAKQVFAGVVRDFPNAAASTDAQAALAALDKPSVIGTTETPATNGPPSAPQPAAAPPAVIRPWAPPDVDAKEYVVAPDVNCSTEQLLHRTQARTMKQIANLGKFLPPSILNTRMSTVTGTRVP
jgi:hypothetical protein